ncbi:Kinesin-like protein KIF14 [Acipenser ruthenus]|uniref:Kinesin-like protein KIF14 n=1 Tax=Acipenser ruthenus TaxID=7906 RepID=A0A444TZJ6_ACIRT|nr:Kinesin-like protein KIF14 [Acipenser ruthenus]
MPIYTTPTRNHTALFGRLQPKNSELSDLSKSNNKLKAHEQGENSKSIGQSSLTLDKSKEINKTYVVSAGKRFGGTPGTPRSEGRLTLQRRKTDYKGAQNEKEPDENDENKVEVPEKRLTLQRRTRTGSIDKSSPEKDKIITEKQGEITSLGSQQQANNKVLFVPDTGSKTLQVTSVQRSGSLRDPLSKFTPRTKPAPSTPGQSAGKVGEKPIKSYQTVSAESALNKCVVPKAEGLNKLTSTPTKRTPVAKVNAKDTMRESIKPANTKYGSLERQRTPLQANGESVKPTAKYATLQDNTKFLIGTQGRSLLSNLQVTKPRKMVSSANSASIGAKSGYGTPGKGISSKEEITRQSTALGQDALKMENSAVTVAVRVRPFNNREKTEKAHQVVFMESQETIVQHPESKQSHSFVYDFSFWSFDKTHPSFASQKTVYEKLALPLLERAFEGYNTCLFAYGQTGSGKSYTMMGFSEDAGVIPRFCEDLFSRVKKSENQEVSYRLEMSYFEVYNEKIHDLLVVKDENCQNKQPLRVREHPVFGPYVADLSMNVVGSFDDIQSWLELGNKQRATAATGMNDKSSRSHSVFTLVMTQTKTEFVDEEEHDHTITSRINLVDLAGSERCSTAQTSGDRLKEGVSINKSLLTLGKVISALSEHTSQNKKKVFIPYRESVLTWLLKESLGGNSKTAMIATISPAASYVEESLSTLRYAKQARMIINIAKVNEDTNAKLIRELKAEVEKLKAAQMSIQGIEPEKFKLFRQEIVSLKMQLTQQEREMAEAHRTWKEKLEQAEKRKREETKELQKAGITFKVDNRLPNLVNLNEDPQLSEMLLYMIKEGQTKVGRYKSNSAHDINLSGALIADDHCVISNIAGTVSITPVKDAKTYVNGILVSDSTVLHHGDRIILGGDHYFRFNHPVEVQSGKRVSCWTGPGDGPKDFEFAKNELLSAQRAQLEEEIEEARMKAKEEMIQGIQVAKEMAQKELSDQKTLYENRIKALEKELGEEAQKKKLQELNNKKAVSKIEELQSVKTQLELKVQVNKKRLEMEALATRQALSDHDTRHAKIIEALEAEKKKITEDLERIQQKRLQKEKGSVPQNTDKESADDKELLQVQVQNTKLGITTVWSLEKFENNLAAMRELDQGNAGSRDDDVFYDPNDEWEPDISASSTSSSFSRRRSRSLLKGRRISGRLYEIRVHPIQSLLNSQNSGLINTHSAHSSISESTLPRICKELIGSAVEKLRTCGGNESLPDRLISDILTIHTGVTAISDFYEHLDDESQENLFACNCETQSQLIRVTSAFERVAFFTMQWNSDVKPCSGSTLTVAEGLQGEVKKVGGYLQLLIQGCDSDISSMVTEALKKSNQSIKRTVQLIGQLALVTGTELHTAEHRSEGARTYKLLQELKKNISVLATSIQNYIMHCKQRSIGSLEGHEDGHSEHLKTVKTIAVEFIKFIESIRQIQPIVISALRDNRSQTVGQMPFDWIDGGSISYHNFSLNVNYMPNTGECVTIDPVTGSWGLEICSKPKRALCQYDKDVYEHLQRFSLIPQTSFFFTVSREPLVSAVMDELQINTTGIQRNLSRVNSLTGVMLKVLDENPDILTSADLLYLTQFMGTVVELGVVEMENASEAFVSLATNWFKLASKIIDTGLSAQWLELTEQVVIPGPFAVIKNIDSLAVLMADTLSMAGMSFTLSTKNIDLHIEPRTLSHLSCGCVFKPGTLGSHSGNQDEIQIPDTEVSRLHAMGYRELTFIHVYYSHLVDLQANLYQEPVLHQQKTDSSSQAGRLTTAVISSTVRDPSTRRDIPVAVHYTLSHAELVACTAVAALLHLFFMAAFTWMLVEGLLLWSKVVTVNLSEERRMKYYYLIGWGLPVLIVSITLAATSEKYSADGHCWLSVKNGVIWGFAGPVICIIMVNILVLTRVVLITLSTAKRRAIMLALNSSPIEQAYDQIRAAVKAVLVLLPILGLTWLCGVLVPFSIVMAYIFVLLNSLQVRSTIDRIKERRRAQNFSNCANSRPSSSVTSSRPASSPALGLQDLSHDLGLGSHCASEPDQQNIPNKPDSSMVYENSAATSDRQLSIPSLPRGPDEDLPCFALGSLTPEQSCQGDLTLPNMLDSTEDGCSLHVPMDFDSYSCISGSAAPHKRSGCLYLD